MKIFISIILFLISLVACPHSGEHIYDLPVHGATYVDAFGSIRSFDAKSDYVVRQDSVKFNSVQPSSINQVLITFRLVVGDSITIFWGDGTFLGLKGTGENQAANSNYTTANTTYNISITGDLSGVRYLYFVDETTLDNITSAQIKKFKKLEILRLYNCGTTHSIYSSDLAGLPLKHFTIYYAGTGHNINSYDFIGKSLDYFRLVNAGTNNTINTAHFVGMPLTYFEINNSGTNNTGKISDLPTGLTDLRVIASGQGISISSGAMKAWASTEIRLLSAYSTTSVDGFLNAWAPVAGSGTKMIYLAGSGDGIANQPRSSASDAAVTTLQGLGKTIQTNP